MSIFLYLILLIAPFPLIYFTITRNDHLFTLPIFFAIVGIYVFNIIGSINVIFNNELFNWVYYLSLLSLISLFYVFYFFVDAYKKQLSIKWEYVESKEISTHILLVIFLWLWSFALIGLYCSRHGLPVIFSISTSEFTDIYALRAEKTTSLKEGSHWYNLGFITIPSFIIVYLYILKQKIQPTYFTFFYYLNLTVAIAVMSMNMTKSQYFYLIIYLMIAKMLLTSKAPNIRQFINYIFIGIVSFIILLRLYLLDRRLYDVVILVPKFLFDRIFGVYSEAHAYITRIFPAEHELFYGYTFSNPGGLLPYEPAVNLSQYLGFLAHGSALQNYSYPSFSEGFANFGWVGFFLIVIIMFIQITLIQVIFKSCKKNTLSLTMYVILTEKMLHYGIEPIQLIIPEEFIFFCLIIILFVFATKSINKGLNLLSKRNQLLVVK